MTTTIRAGFLVLGMVALGAGVSGPAAPAMAYGTHDAGMLTYNRDVGREAFAPMTAGVPTAMRPATLAREQMPTGLTGWRHNGTDLVSNGQAAYPVLTQTAQDHPPSGLDHGTLLTERFPAPDERPHYADALPTQPDLGRSRVLGVGIIGSGG